MITLKPKESKPTLKVEAKVERVRKAKVRVSDWSFRLKAR